MSIDSVFGYDPIYSGYRLQDLADVDRNMEQTSNQTILYNSTREQWEAGAPPDPNNRNNFSATTDPTVNDDTADGYQVGSLWVNTTSDAAFICVDATNGAAVWKDITTDPERNLSASSAPTVNDDSGDGYSPGSVWVDTTNDTAYICLDASSGAAIWRLITPATQNNYAASVAPTVNDDSGVGYSVSSFWIDTTADIAYICVDASSGAAVWKKTTSSEPKSNYVATTNPGVGDDDADGYSSGSMWVNTTLGTAYICTDASTGAAVWAEHLNVFRKCV